MINSFYYEFSELISLELLHALTTTTAAIRGTNDFLYHIFDDTIDGIDAADGRSFARPGKSNRRGRNDYEDSTWGRMLTDDPSSQLCLHFFINSSLQKTEQKSDFQSCEP